MGSFLSSIYSRYFSFCFRRINQVINPNGRIRLPDIEEDTWWSLENPHADVDLFWSLLVGVYGYSPEDIIVLKDGPNTPDLRQPTRANMIRELEKLVFGAAPGDKFTFFYSGHSDQQNSRDSVDVEEDGQDEVIVTSDLERIIDNELHEILVKPLPAGCFLLSVFDTCHSGTMLDLPHHHCNGVYVPWHSKGQRAMPTVRNKIVRNHAMGHSGLHGSASQLPSIARVMARNIDNNIRLHTDPLPSPCAPLRINTQVGGSIDEANRRWMSMGDSEGYSPREGRRPRSIAALVSPTRYESPVSFVKCDGWCDYDPSVHRTVLSLSACSDPQRAWEGPRGSLTTVLCKFLKTQPRPSYRDLMSHVNFALHENARELHAYTREQKKKEARGEGNGFDGELDNFQEPKLSSLAKLNMDDIFHL
ncbi:caspase domain-containing protein [Lactarius indigo]|nr:caspase domain-containing protein [Lactarius indigo]